MAPSDRFVAETTFRVRYAETDAMGIVHHSRYVVYLEEGRSDYARQRGTPYSLFEAEGHLLMVVEVSLRYSQPARYEQLITVRTWLADMQSRGLTFAYEIVDATAYTLLVSGQTRHICVDKAGRVTRIPGSWRAWGTNSNPPEG